MRNSRRSAFSQSLSPYSSTAVASGVSRDTPVTSGRMRPSAPLSPITPPSDLPPRETWRTGDPIHEQAPASRPALPSHEQAPVGRPALTHPPRASQGPWPRTPAPVPHRVCWPAQFRTSRPGRPTTLLLSRARPPGRPGLTATMPHRGGQDSNDVTSWRLRSMALGDW
jgi:hypothetical protein